MRPGCVLDETAWCSQRERHRRVRAGAQEFRCRSVELGANSGMADTEATSSPDEQLVRRADGASYHSEQRRQGLPVPALRALRASAQRGRP